MGQFDFTSEVTAIKLGNHSARHEDGGADEISLTGLSGDPADTINESLLTTQNDIIVRGASVAERLNITAQTLVGRLTGGNISAVALGIADNNIAQIDHASAADNDYAKFTAAGLEGRSYAELRSDINMDALNEPTGFPTTFRTDSTLSFAGTIFTITPSGSFDYYIAGVKYTKSSTENIVIADTSGVQLIYYDTGMLSKSVVNPSNDAIEDIILNMAWVATIYWNATDEKAHLLADERHGCQMSGKTHHWLHDVNGAAWHDGFTLSGEAKDTATDAALTFELTNGVYFDEDLTLTIINGTYTNQYEQQLNDGDAVIPVVYKDTSGKWTQDAATTLPYKSLGAGRLAYNKKNGSSWSQAEVENKKWVSMTLIATNDWQYPIKAIQGQNEYTDKKTAVEEATAEIISFGGGTLSPEVITLYRFVMRTDDDYGGEKKAKIVEITDFRGAQILGEAAAASDHGTLSGLADDDHAQYLRTDGTRTLTGDFTGGGYDLDNIGHIGLGNQAAHARYGIDYYEKIALPDNNGRMGVYSVLDAYKTSADYTGYIAGANFEVYVTSENTWDWTNAIGLRGCTWEVRTETGMSTIKTLTGAAAVRIGASFGADTNDMIVINYYGAYVAPLTLVGNSKLTNDYGIYVASQAGGSTLNYAIYTAGGLVYHAGAMTLGSTLTVTGAVLTTPTLNGTTTLGSTPIFDVGSGYLEIDTTGAVGLLMDGGITAGGIAPLNNTRNYIAGDWVAGAIGTGNWFFRTGGEITGHSGANSSVGGTYLDNSVVLTGNTAIITQLRLDEPDITLGGNTATVAATLYINAAPDEGITSKAIYVVSGDCWYAGEVSALSFDDRSPFYAGDALAEIKVIKGKDGKIDHKTLPISVQKPKKNVIWGVDEEGKRIPVGTGDVIERDIGAMVSVLTVGVQQLTDRIEALEH